MARKFYTKAAQLAKEANLPPGVDAAELAGGFQNMADVEREMHKGDMDEAMHKMNQMYTAAGGDSAKMLSMLDPKSRAAIQSVLGDTTGGGDGKAKGKDKDKGKKRRGGGK